MGEGLNNEKQILETEKLKEVVENKLKVARASVDSLYEDIKTCNYNDTHSIRELFYRTRNAMDQILKCIGG